MMFRDVQNAFVSAIFSTPTFRFTDLQLSKFLFSVHNATVRGLADCVNYFQSILFYTVTLKTSL
jgi:hypothetical protein